MTSPVPLVGLRAHDCRWPVGDETGLRQRFCCLPVITGRSYCHEHLHRSSISAVSPRGVAAKEVKAPFEDVGKADAFLEEAHGLSARVFSVGSARVPLKYGRSPLWKA